VVTHDRDLIGQFATRLWAFTPEGLVDFRGTYDEFLEKMGSVRRGHPGRRCERQATLR
jgi:ATPase subunit of ABC transporter with duplicated ATPase domains